MKKRRIFFGADKMVAVLSLLSVILLVAAFIVPPHGIIDPSVLAAVGEIFAFSALITASNHLSNGKDAKIRHNNTEITIGDLDDVDDK